MSFTVLQVPRVQEEEVVVTLPSQDIREKTLHLHLVFMYVFILSYPFDLCFNVISALCKEPWIALVSEMHFMNKYALSESTADKTVKCKGISMTRQSFLLMSL